MTNLRHAPYSINVKAPFGLLNAPALVGVRACPDPQTAVEEVAKTVFKLPGTISPHFVRATKTPSQFWPGGFVWYWPMRSR